MDRQSIDVIARIARDAAVDATRGIEGVELVVIVRSTDARFVSCCSTTKTVEKAHTMLGQAAEMLRRSASDSG